MAVLTVPNIHISYAQTINLNKVYSQKRIQLPEDAKVIQTIINNSTDMPDDTLALFLIFDRFHSYRFTLTLTNNKIINRITLDSIIYKYGSNIAVSAALEDQLVIKYIIDIGFGKMGELYGCFDLSKPTQGKLLSEYHSFATYSLIRYGNLNSPS